MLSVVIKDNGEKSVVNLTYQNLWRELKDIPGVELMVNKNWFDAIQNVKNGYVCFVESDCLVNSGYFSSQMGLLKKDSMFRKIAMLSSSTGVNNWANKFYGYSLGSNYTDGVLPVLNKKSTAVYPVQIGYVPGAILRMTMLKEALLKLNWLSPPDDLVKLSSELSIAFWRQGDGNRVHLNPNTTYVTTEDYVNDIGNFEINPGKLIGMFTKELI